MPNKSLKADNTSSGNYSLSLDRADCNPDDTRGVGEVVGDVVEGGEGSRGGLWRSR